LDLSTFDSDDLVLAILVQRYLSSLLDVEALQNRLLVEHSIETSGQRLDCWSVPETLECDFQNDLFQSCEFLMRIFLLEPNSLGNQREGHVGGYWILLEETQEADDLRHQ
jgi:hypothetical protein